MSKQLFKLVFFVPEAFCEKVKEAVFKTGAGTIGNYTRCCFQVLGEGQFYPQAQALPSVGSVGSLEKVREFRVEILCESENVSNAITALMDAHPYEEPAWEVYEVLNNRFNR